MALASLSEREPHHARIRWRARAIYGVTVPLVIIAAAFWLGFNTVVCQGRTVWWETLICTRGRVIPGVFTLLAFASFVWFGFSMATFGDALRPDDEPSDRSTLRHVHHARRAYRSLDDAHRAIAFFALEMSAWALGVVITILIFYWTAYAFPLGLLVLGAVVRVFVALVGYLTVLARRLFGAGGPTPRPASRA